MAQWKIVCNDVIRWAAEYSGQKFHALLADPSYALSKKKKVDPDTPIETEIKTVEDLVKAYHSFQQWGGTGFMNRDWDTAIAFNPETWRALAEHLLPGGFLFVFASSRGWHRLACALEDAGLIIQPSIFNWRTREVVEVPPMFLHLTGQSFPKATRISGQLDDKWAKENYGSWCKCKDFVESTDMGICSCCKKPKRPKGQPKIDVGSGKQKSIKQVRAGVGKGLHKGWERPYHFDDNHCEQLTRHPGLVTDLARAWEGHRYGGQILKDAAGPVIIAMKKPDTEPSPVIVAQKPWEGKRLDCIVETGAGALWVDGVRVGLAGMEEHRTPARSGLGKHGIYSKSTIETLEGKDLVRYSSKGRWPSNFCLTHSEGCERTGVKRVKSHNPDNKASVVRGGQGIYGEYAPEIPHIGYADPDGMETVDDFSCVPECPIARLDEQAGERGGRWGSHSGRSPNSTVFPDRSAGNIKERVERFIGDNSGGPSRFYMNADWSHEVAERIARADWEYEEVECDQANRETASDDEVFGQIQVYSEHEPDLDWSHEVAERIAGADPVRYCPKAARKERDAGLEGLGMKRSGVGCDRPSGDFNQRLKPPGRDCENPRTAHNHHPCCKPISLCKHLATLLLPPKEYAPRRILIPFCGTMSEGIGALLAGWDEIVGIDSEQDYVDIGDARMKFWQAKMEETGTSDPKAILKARKVLSKQKAKSQQDKLF